MKDKKTRQKYKNMCDKLCIESIQMLDVETDDYSYVSSHNVNTRKTLSTGIKKKCECCGSEKSLNYFTCNEELMNNPEIVNIYKVCNSCFYKRYKHVQDKLGLQQALKCFSNSSILEKIKQLQD